jgi:hypothetical protein
MEFEVDATLAEAAETFNATASFKNFGSRHQALSAEEHLDIKPPEARDRPTIHFVCNNGCNLFHTVSAMIFCPAAVGWI